jgi:hypothetical protein
VRDHEVDISRGKSDLFDIDHSFNTGFLSYASFNQSSDSNMRNTFILALVVAASVATLPVTNDTAEYEYVIIGSGPGGGTLA